MSFLFLGRELAIPSWFCAASVAGEAADGPAGVSHSRAGARWPASPQRPREPGGAAGGTCGNLSLQMMVVS